MITKDTPIEAGTVVKNYVIMEQVGKGGMGAVYRAKAPDGQIVALKILASHLTDNDVQRKRFYQEAEVAMKLTHPNIVRAIEVGEANGQHFFAMEFVEGENLGKKIKDFGRLPEEESIRIISEVAAALEEAHLKGLIHRDVKPDNVMVTPTGDVKLADMGLMKQLENDLNLTKTGKGLGTPHFMAPEQFRDAKHADARCDVYSLGATLYMMVTGELPFRGSGPLDAFIKKSKNEYKPPKEINPDLTPRLAAIIQMTMDAEPNNRPQSARSFIDLLKGNSSPNPSVQASKNGKAATPPADMWYVIFSDENGKEKKVKGTTAAIEKQLKMGLIRGDARLSRQRGGPFEPVQKFKDFARILLSDTAEPMLIGPDGVAMAEMTTPSGERKRDSKNDMSPTAWTIGKIRVGRKEMGIAGGFILVCLLAIAAWLVFRH